MDIFNSQKEGRSPPKIPFRLELEKKDEADQE